MGTLCSKLNKELEGQMQSRTDFTTSGDLKFTTLKQSFRYTKHVLEHISSMDLRLAKQKVYGLNGRL
uniref:Uncharacterized protein n=1 Tax=Arion vulgaris TaxID=1028688 RepID=A0A0B7A3H6_9EUPU